MLHKHSYLFASLFFISINSIAQKDTKQKSVLILPLITKSIETNWSFGAASVFTFKMKQDDTVSRTSNIEIVGIHTLNKQLVVAVNGNEYFKKEKYILNHQFSYSSFPDKFWGIGSNTKPDAAEQYTFRQYYFVAHLLKNIRKKFFVGMLAEHQNVLKVNYLQNGLFDSEHITGRNGYKTVGVGVSITNDTRNHAFTSNKGSFFQLLLTKYSTMVGSSYNFTALVADYRKYITIASAQVLALQAYSLNNFGNDIPLRNLGALGGANSMRGYYSGRFRDKNLLVLQAEYRCLIYKRLGAVAFGGIGNVANNVSEYTFNQLKCSYGGGLRFALNKKENLNVRIDYGFATDGNSGLYFQIGEAF